MPYQVDPYDSANMMRHLGGRIDAVEREYEREWTSDRSFLHTYTAGAWLPALQAVVSGVMFGLIVGVLAMVTQRPKWALWGFVAMLIFEMIIWLLLLWRWLNLTAPIERITGWDLNRDGYIGEREPMEPQRVVIELRQNEGRHVQFAHLQIEMRKLEEMCQGLVSGIPFSEGEWTGGGKPFSRQEFRELRDVFMARGWLEWVNDSAHQQGVKLTYPGEAVVRHLANTSPTARLGDGN